MATTVRRRVRLQVSEQEVLRGDLVDCGPGDCLTLALFPWQPDCSVQRPVVRFPEPVRAPRAARPAIYADLCRSGPPCPAARPMRDFCPEKSYFLVSDGTPLSGASPHYHAKALLTSCASSPARPPRPCRRGFRRFQCWRL
jgi:hypothetical protein